MQIKNQMVTKVVTNESIEQNLIEFLSIQTTDMNNSENLKNQKFYNSNNLVYRKKNSKSTLVRLSKKSSK